MHRDHDLDLLSALAEGNLADPALAERLIDTCPECAAVYRAHSTVLQAVEAEARPRLTELERARLHTSLWEEVSRAPAQPARTSTSPWWYRLAPIAAVLVVVVGIGVTGQLGGGDAATDIAGDSATTAAEDTSRELAPLSDDAASPEATEAPADTLAAAETTAADGGDSREESAAGGADLAWRQLPEALDDFRRRAASADRSVPDRFDCPPPEEVEDDPVVVEETRVEGEPAWLAAFGNVGDISAVAAYRQADCEVLEFDR